MIHVVLNILGFTLFFFLSFLIFAEKGESTADPNTDLRLVYLNRDEELLRLRRMRGEVPTAVVKAKPKQVYAEFRLCVLCGKNVYKRKTPFCAECEARGNKYRSRPLPVDNKTAEEAYNQSMERAFRHREWPDHGTCFCPECETKRLDQ